MLGELLQKHTPPENRVELRKRKKEKRWLYSGCAFILCSLVPGILFLCIIRAALPVRERDLALIHFSSHLCRRMAVMLRTILIKMVHNRIVSIRHSTEDAEKVVVEPYDAADIDFDTFCKSDMRVVKVKDCVAVKKSKKLLQFTLDDGSGTDRTILSGMHSYYEPEELVGKTLVAIVNIPPRAMMGIVSHGMFLSAECKKGKMRL